VAIISCARVIFLVELTDLMRERNSRTLAIRQSPSPRSTPSMLTCRSSSS